MISLLVLFGVFVSLGQCALMALGVYMYKSGSHFFGPLLVFTNIYFMLAYMTGKY